MNCLEVTAFQDFCQDRGNHLGVKFFVSGTSCERCAENYFGNPLVAGGTCERCVCNNNIDHGVSGSCDAATGECLKCQYFTEGFYCERCKPGYFGDAARQSCQRQFFSNIVVLRRGYVIADADSRLIVVSCITKIARTCWTFVRPTPAIT